MAGTHFLLICIFLFLPNATWQLSETQGPSQGNICHEALGMETRTIADNQMNAFSELTVPFKVIYSAASARLKIKIPFPCCFGWVPSTSSTSAWLEIDLQKKHTVVTGVATQGGKSWILGSMFVTKYKLQYGNDSGSLVDYMESDTKNQKVFYGNNDSNSVVPHDLVPHIKARYIRFCPLLWNNKISMRVELYGCNHEDVTTSIFEKPVTSTKLSASETTAMRTTTLQATITTTAKTVTPSTKISVISIRSSCRIFTPTLISRRNRATVSISSSLLSTIENIRGTPSASASTSSFTGASTKGKLQQFSSDVNALNVSRIDSLMRAINKTRAFIEDLRSDPTENRDTNMLVAFQALESFVVDYGKIHSKVNESKVITQRSFAIKIQKVSANNRKVVTFTANETDFSEGEDKTRISIPSVIFQEQVNYPPYAIVVSFLYNGIKQWIPDEGNLELNGKTIANLTIGSRVISSTVYPKPNGIFKENVTISFSYEKGIKEKVTPHCVFWDFKAKSKVSGSWSGKGCSFVNELDKEITCTCNHLTNFAVLMQVGANSKVSPGHKDALEVITYVGCALSLLGGTLTIVTYWTLMSLKEEQIQIRLNLVVAIVVAQITFLAGIDASETKGLCVFVAGLIHYFYLAGFAWMLFEGVYLYLMVVKVFNTVIRMRLFYGVAWGVSLLIVLLSMVIAFTQDGGIYSYVHGDFCWVSFTNNLVWTFVTPVLAVCLVNAVILVRVVNEIIKMQSGKTSELERIRQGAKASVVLFPLLGLTWVFGILSVTDAGLVFQYIFTILNSLQGLFIFILHVLRNADVRAAYLRKKQKWKAARSIGTSHSSNHDSIALGSSKIKKEPENSRSKSCCTSPRSEGSVIGYDNPFVFDHDRCMTPVDT